MNSFLGLFFCSLAPAVTFAWNANEKPPFIPLSATQNQRHNPRQLASFPGQGLTVQKFLQIKYALELKCLKELCNHPRYRNICYGGKPFKRSRLLPPLQSIPQQQILFFNTIKENPLIRRQSGTNEWFFPKDKMTYLPTIKYFNNMRVSPPPQEESKRTNNPQQKLGKILPGKTSKIVQGENLLDQLLPEDKESRELLPKNLPRGTEKDVSEGQDIPITRSPDNGNRAEVKPPRATTHRPIHPYEVREIIVEKPEPFKYSNDFKGFQMGSKKLANVSLLMKEKPVLPEFKNTSFVLKPMETSPAFNPTPNHRPRVLVDKSNEPQSQRIRQEQPDTKNPFNDYLRIWRDTTIVEPKTNTPSFNSITFSPEHVNKPDLLRATTQSEKYTTSVYSSEAVETEFNGSGLTKTSESVEDIQLLGSTYSNQDLTLSSTEETIKGSSLFPTLIKSGNPLTVSSSEIQTTSSLFWQISDNLRSAKDPKADPTSAKTEFFLGTKNQEGVTTPNLKEITVRPGLRFFTKMKPDIKKDYDGSLKNSRKMHFGQKDTWKTTISNEIPDFEQNEPRRSDILISENNDYFDYDNSFSDVNYLKKLQLNHSLDLHNLTSEVIIPLIPTVVNDLREGRIPTEDMSTLSEVFGKYWTTVTNLSNNTVLDMLPLMKLKNESDLENLLRSLQPEEGSNDTTTEVEDYNYFTLGSYDFIENYKDLYKDFPMEEEEAAEEYNFDITNITPSY